VTFATFVGYFTTLVVVGLQSGGWEKHYSGRYNNLNGILQLNNLMTVLTDEKGRFKIK
jgi:hypothetical protein